MKRLIIILFILLFTGTVFAATPVTIVPKPIQKILYDDATTVEYFGWAAVGTATSAASWKIMRISYTGNDFVIEWAEGSASYTNIWDNRATTVTYK